MVDKVPSFGRLPSARTPTAAKQMCTALTGFTMHMSNSFYPPSPPHPKHSSAGRGAKWLHTMGCQITREEKGREVEGWGESHLPFPTYTLSSIPTPLLLPGPNQ